jgi:hypothetical protein
MPTNDWTRHRFAILAGISLSSLIVGFLCYLLLFGSQDDTGFRQLVSRTSRIVAGVDQVKIGKVTLASHFAYRAEDIQLYRNKALIASFREASVSIYPLSGIFGDVYVLANLIAKKGGQLNVVAQFPVESIFDIQKAKLTSLEIKADKIPLAMFTNSLLRRNDKLPVRLMEGEVTGRLSFVDRKSIKKKTGHLHLGLQNVMVYVNCRDSSVQWKGCDRKRIKLDPLTVYAVIKRGKITLKDPISLSMFLNQQTAKIRGSALLKYPMPIDLRLSVPSSSAISGLLRGGFDCRTKASRYRLTGRLDKTRCRKS